MAISEHCQSVWLSAVVIFRLDDNLRSLLFLAKLRMCNDLIRGSARLQYSATTNVNGTSHPDALRGLM